MHNVVGAVGRDMGVRQKSIHGVYHTLLFTESG